MNPAIKNEASLADMLELIGKKLLELRLRKGYTSHAEFAADFDLPRIQYWRMEKGRANFTFKSLHKVVTIHGLTIEELFYQISKEQRLKN
jgi:transcriptional regulator with XRE-family HTH domain